MKIVVLDAFTLNPGDLDWTELKSLGVCEIYDRTPSEQIVERSLDADVVLTNKTPLSQDTIGKLSKLKYIGVLATGYDVVDVEFAGKRGIPVTNVPNYGSESVAQMVFAHILNLTNHVAQHAEEVRKNRWAHSPDFCFWDYPMIALNGLTLGIVGAGRIGMATANLGNAFHMKVIAYNPRRPLDTTDEIEFVDLEVLLKTSDIITLHCPLTPETKGFINKDRLAMMKPSAFLINTSRGALINEEDLAFALNNGIIGAAGLDVLDQEPPRPDHPLNTLKNCYITPHISWATNAARSYLMKIAIENLRSFLKGRTQNVVN